MSAELTHQWQRLLSPQRLGKQKNIEEQSRTAYQRDFDRIIFSSAFRRLQDKTQVFPLAQNDNVRTRLSHSLEVSSVGRSLGTNVGVALMQRYPELDVSAHDFGAIVAAACLAHDIGNPPFGHAGEDAIQSWFAASDLAQSWLSQLSDAEQLDMLHFEGNAQGFRLITKLLMRSNPGGLQLSSATLGAFTKYPRFSDGNQVPGNPYKKFGIFSSERAIFTDLAQALNLPKISDYIWARHPLCYLVEAADDICYRIVDIEDACRRQVIPFIRAEELLLPLLSSEQDVDRYYQLATEFEKLEFLRAKAIGNMILQSQSVFLDNESAIVAGQFSGEILDHIQSAKPLADLKEEARNHVYRSRIVAEVSVPGYTLLADLLERFGQAFEQIAKDGDKAHSKHHMVMALLPDEYQYIHQDLKISTALRVMALTDFISGMTDAYALHLYKTITGIHVMK